MSIASIASTDPAAQPWWKRPLRVIQPNLQIRDTERIDPERLAAQLEEMGGNTIVFNVGGIYAWYRTGVPFHTQNEFLPASADLLAEVIEACHRRGLRFIARFDFSKADDAVYQRKPQWFVRDAAGEPQVIGSRRPGPWSLLMSTCINGAYRGEAVAIPVLDEVLTRYPIDGIFFNNPGYIPCYCDGCRRKYRDAYGEELPADAKSFRPDWASRCMKDNIDRLHRFVAGKAPHVPLILYYNLYRDSLYDRAATADMLCTEPQDVLSLGRGHIPEFWKPALSIKLGRSLPDYPVPFGIVHSCPGMDWRHTGLPPAEYRFWLCQIPANGGQIWHSLTGVPDTITDKRILEVVSEHNAMVKRIEPYMEGAAPDSAAALVWNAAASGEGWADGFLDRQIPFDVLLPEQVEAGRLAGYRVCVLPESLPWSDPLEAALKRFVEAGGQLIVEGIPERDGIGEFLGIGPEVYTGEELIAAYMRFEGEDNPLQRGMEQTELIAHRGRVAYTEPRPGTASLLTLVPPFSPLESVGAPPERASLPVPRTDIPLALHRRAGAGGVTLLPFSLSRLIAAYGLDEHYRLLYNMIRFTAGGTLPVEVSHAPGLQVTVFRKGEGRLVQLVNGAGRRPLAENIPLHEVAVSLEWSGRPAPTRARAILSGTDLPVAAEGDRIRIILPKLQVWEVLWIE